MGKLPLEGIRILDHTIAWAGPQATVRRPATRAGLRLNLP